MSRITVLAAILSAFIVQGCCGRSAPAPRSDFDSEEVHAILLFGEGDFVLTAQATASYNNARVVILRTTIDCAVRWERMQEPTGQACFASLPYADPVDLVRLPDGDIVVIARSGVATLGSVGVTGTSVARLTPEGNEITPATAGLLIDMGARWQGIRTEDHGDHSVESRVLLIRSMDSKAGTQNISRNTRNVCKNDVSS